VGYACYFAGEFFAVFELYYADGVGCFVLELFWGDVDDCVRDEFAFVGHLGPCEGLAVAVVA